MEPFSEHVRQKKKGIMATTPREKNFAWETYLQEHAHTSGATMRGWKLKSGLLMSLQPRKQCWHEFCQCLSNAGDTRVCPAPPTSNVAMARVFFIHLLFGLVLSRANVNIELWGGGSGLSHLREAISFSRQVVD